MNYFIEIAGTFLYRELFKRNTLRPMKKIIRESGRPELQHRLLRQWARTKYKESQYIQVAGGLLFTSVVSCLQWPSTINAHWFAPTSFYSSILFALLAIVMGSQQLLLLPNETDPYSDDGFDALTAIDTRYTSEEETRKTEFKYLQKVVKRLTTTKHDDRPNPILVFALQTPIMLLTLSVMCFLTGLSTIVFAPLAKKGGWGDEAKIALLVGIAGFLCAGIFLIASYLVHGLFSIRLEPTAWSIERLAQIQNIIFPGLSGDPETAERHRSTGSARVLDGDGHVTEIPYDKPGAMSPKPQE